MTAGIFGANFLQAIGLWNTTPTIAPWLIALFSVAVCLVMALSPVRTSMRTLLWVEVLTASLIVLIGAVVIVRVASGHAPGHHPFTLNMFTVPPGVGTSTLFLGIVFGFLSFAGFEAAATLGEEAADPRRAIPRAIFGVGPVRRRVLHDRHRGRDARLRHHGQGRSRVRRLVFAVRHPGRGVRHPGRR